MTNKKTLVQMTESDAALAGISSLADRPNDASRYGDGGLTAKALKKRFDALPNLVRQKFNEIATMLTAADAAKYIGLDGSVGGVDNLYDFLLLFGSRGDGAQDKNISDYIETLYQGEGDNEETSYTLREIVQSIISRFAAVETDKGAKLALEVSDSGEITLELLNAAEEVIDKCTAGGQLKAAGIADGAVTGEKIKDGAVSFEKLDSALGARIPARPTSNDEGRFLKASGGKIVFSDIGVSQFPKLRAPLSVTVDSRGMTVTVENRDAPFILKNRIYLEDEKIATIEEGATADFSAFVGDRVAIKVGVTAVADGFKESDKIFARWGLTNGTEGLTYSGQTCTGIGAATESEIEIASYHNGDPVLYIAIGAFRDCTALTSVKIPNTVEDIGRDAFHGCTALKSIIIPESVTDIHNSAFYGCKSLESITMSNIKKYVGDIGNNTFYGCEALKSITIPYGATCLGDCAFKGCSSLTSVTIPDSVTTIYSESFSGCSSLTSVTIPDSITKINSNAFNGCTALTSITIPDGVKDIGSYTFYGCTALTNVTISNGLNSIGYYAFEDCSKLTSITIPESVTNISPSAFRGCTSLKAVTFSGTPTSIGHSVFTNCSSLTDIYVPWSEGEVANAPWGATNATIHYNSEG